MLTYSSQVSKQTIVMSTFSAFALMLSVDTGKWIVDLEYCIWGSTAFEVHLQL